MPVNAQDIFDGCSAAVVEERHSMRYAPEAGWIELFYTLGIAQAHIVRARRRISRRWMAACTIATLEDEATTLNCGFVACAAQFIERRGQPEGFEKRRQRINVFAC